MWNIWYKTILNVLYSELLYRSLYMIIISFLVLLNYFQMTFTTIFNVKNTFSVTQMINLTVNVNHNKPAVYFFNAPAVVWMKTKLLLVLLFTFPATYSYLLLITLPPSVVTKTQSNPGALLDITLIGAYWVTLLENWQTVLFIFHFPRVKPCVGVS